MLHDFSPLSGCCLSCGDHVTTAGPECYPNAAEPDSMSAGFARFSCRFCERGAADARLQATSVGMVCARCVAERMPERMEMAA